MLNSRMVYVIVLLARSKATVNINGQIPSNCLIYQSDQTTYLNSFARKHRRQQLQQHIATALATAPATATASKKELEKIASLCERLSISQLDDYSTWIKLGMILKSLGAPLVLWQTISMKSNKLKVNDCSSRWDKFNQLFKW